MKPATGFGGMGCGALVVLMLLTAAIPTPAAGLGAKAGALLWTRQFGTSEADAAKAVSVDGSSVYVAGPMGLHGFLQKFDPDGNALWTRQFGTSMEDFTNAVAAGASGVYVAGYTTTADDHDVFLQKFDPDGNALWTRQFGTSEFDFATAVAVDASGVYVGGHTLGTFPGETSAGTDAFLRKYDFDGNVMWTHQFGTSGADGALAIAVDAFRVYVAGWTTGTFPGQPSVTGYQDAFLRTYDPDGNVIWTRQFGPAETDAAHAVAVDASGVYVAGKTGIVAFVQKFDRDGKAVWTRQFGTDRDTYAWAVALNRSIVYVVGQTDGTFPGETSAGGYDAFVRTYDEDGNVVWTLQFGTAEDDGASSVGAGAFGVYVAGWTTGALAGQSSSGRVDAFLARVAETPDAPDNLRTTSGDGTVNLTWDPPAFNGGSPVENYRIYRWTTSEGLMLLAEVEIVYTYADTAVANGVTYYYAVSAVNAMGEGPTSSGAVATPAGPDTTPPTVSIASPQGEAILQSATVTVMGTASDDVAVEKVQVSADGTTWVLASGTTSWSAALTLREGSNTIAARATDTSGKVATTYVTVTVDLLGQPPEGAPLLLFGLLAGGAILIAIVLAAYIMRRRKR